MTIDNLWCQPSHTGQLLVVLNGPSSALARQQYVGLKL